MSVRSRLLGGTLRQREARTGILLVSPTLVVVFVAVVLPVAWTVMLAFQHVRLLTLRRSGIFGHYTPRSVTQVLTAPDFLPALRVTLIYSVCGTVLSIGVGLIAALALRAPFRGRSLVRGAMLLPYIAPVVAVTFVWQIMLSPQFGIVDDVGVHVLGWHHAIPFLSLRTGQLSLLGWHLGVPTALLTVIAFETWRYFPFTFLFLIARLQAIPADEEEAARVDGATPLQRFRYVILPQLKPVIAMLAVLRFIWTFNKFDDVYLLTGGGNGTGVISVRVYQLLTAEANVSGAAAEALLLAVVLVAALSVYFVFFGRTTAQVDS